METAALLPVALVSTMIAQPDLVVLMEEFSDTLNNTQLDLEIPMQ